MNLKKLFYTFSFVLFLIPSISFAQSDFSVTWEVTGLTDDLIVEVTYDLDVGTNFISAHGAVIFANGLSQPSTGTCMATAALGIFCNVTINALNAVIDIGPTLNGTFRLVGPEGAFVDSGVILFESIQ